MWCIDQKPAMAKGEMSLSGKRQTRSFVLKTEAVLWWSNPTGFTAKGQAKQDRENSSCRNGRGLKKWTTNNYPD